MTGEQVALKAASSRHPAILVPDDALQPVKRRERETVLRQAGTVIWLSGLPETVLSLLSRALERRLFRYGYLAFVVSPAEVGWNCPFSFQAKPRIPETSHLSCSAIGLAGVLAEAGLIAILPLPALSADERKSARLAAPSGRFVEVIFDHRSESVSEGGEPLAADLDGSSDGTARHESSGIRLHLGAESADLALDRLVQLLRSRQFFSPWDAVDFAI